MQEKQFKNLVEKSMQSKGNPGEILVQKLEKRLDNLVYRLGFGSSLRQARQMVVHRHILVNGKTIDRPSYEIQIGDTIELKERSQSIDIYKDNFQSRDVFLPYLEKDNTQLKGRLVANPPREEIPIDVTDSLIIEFYSK